jgi:hypothetical protein
VRAKVPAIDTGLAASIAGFVQGIRRQRLVKTPGVAETLDWANALVAVGAHALADDVVTETLGCVLKDEADIRLVRSEIERRGVAAIVAAGQEPG